MSWRKLRWWLVGALTYLLFLGANMPAAYLSAWVSSRFPDVSLLGVSGTLATGSAAELRVQSVSLGALSWSFDWFAPLTAGYGYRFELKDSDTTLQGRLDAGFGRLTVRDLVGQLPVTSLDRWLPLPPHSINGMLTLSLRRLLFKNGRLAEADGDIGLENATLNWPAAYALGSYRMTLSTVSGTVTGQVVDSASPLRLRADLALAADGRYRLTGALSASNPGDAASQKLLAYLGAPDATGQYPFSLNGQW